LQKALSELAKLKAQGCWIFSLVASLFD